MIKGFQMVQNIFVSHSPHIRKHHSTQSVMLDVVIGLVPAIAASLVFFRMRAAHSFRGYL